MADLVDTLAQIKQGLREKAPLSPLVSECLFVARALAMDDWAELFELFQTSLSKNEWKGKDVPPRKRASEQFGWLPGAAVMEDRRMDSRPGHHFSTSLVELEAMYGKTCRLVSEMKGSRTTNESFQDALKRNVVLEGDLDAVLTRVRARVFQFLPLAEGNVAAQRRAADMRASAASEGNEKKPAATKVMVVHGRNSAIRSSMFAFLRTLKLEPISWSEAVALTGKASPTIPDVLDTAFSAAQAVVILLTGDDEARLRVEYLSKSDPDYERELTPQPRPNVLFEAGLAFGLHPARTVIVEFGALRPFSDIAGRHTIRMDDTSEKRHELATRLATAGCAVSQVGTDWLREGNFAAAAEKKEETRPPAVDVGNTALTPMPAEVVSRREGVLLRGPVRWRIESQSGSDVVVAWAGEMIAGRTGNERIPFLVEAFDGDKFRLHSVRGEIEHGPTLTFQVTERFSVPLAVGSRIKSLRIVLLP